MQRQLIADIGIRPLTPYTITAKNKLVRELKQVRTRYYAVADQELTLGLKTMAIPIFDRRGFVEASFGVSYPVMRASEKGLETALKTGLLAVMNRASLSTPQNANKPPEVPVPI